MCVQWVPDTAPGSVIKIENANQFAPVGSDPKELRTKFHEVHITVIMLFLTLALIVIAAAASSNVTREPCCHRENRVMLL